MVVAAADMGTLEVSTPDCVANDFDGEIVALNLSSGVYWSLRDLAAALWRDVTAGHNPAALCDRLAQIKLDSESAHAQREQGCDAADALLVHLQFPVTC